MRLPVRQGGRLPSHAKEKRLAEMIRRSVFELNGTQWGGLSERVVLDGDVEIEWFGTWPSVTGGWFFADTSDDDENESRFLTNGGAISGFGFPSATALSTIPAASVIHRYQYIRTGNSVGFYVNGNLLATTSYSGQLSFNSLFTKWASSSGIPKFSGIFYDLKIWTNGDRNTGDLIDIPFNERDTDYQRDLTSTITDKNDPNWRGVILQNARPEDWTQVERKRWWNYWLDGGSQAETRWFRKNRLLSGYKFPLTEIGGDFEMTFDATLPLPSSNGGYIFATNELVEDRFLIDNDRVVRDDLGLAAVGTMSGGSIPQSLYIANLLYNFKISRIGNNIEFKINNIFTAYAERLSANDSFFLDSFLMKWGGTTAVEEWVGYFANVKLWAGNSETGILIRAHAIDDPNAVYQINEATGVADLLTINSVPSDWTEAYKDVSDPANPVWRKVSDDTILLEYAA